MHYVFSIFVAVFLSLIAYFRTDFSPQVVAAPMMKVRQEEVSEEMRQLLNQPFVFLGKGRQSFAFVGQDGKTVLKFFNQKYFAMPWYCFALWDFEKEVEKRERRAFFYSQSYFLAKEFLQKQTGILYLHMGNTKRLPSVWIKDRASREFLVDLNQLPFVLQKRGEPFYCALAKVQKAKGDAALLATLHDFLEMIAYRISQGIADHDHDIEHNFGFLDEKPLHLDPGRLCLCDFSEKSRVSHEWWSATHNLRKWLVDQYPDVVTQFDQQLQRISEDNAKKDL